MRKKNGPNMKKMHTPRTNGRALAVVIAGILVLTGVTPTMSFAAEADVVDGSITALSDGRYRISATIAHADTGWEHYADRWDALTPAGVVLGERVLAHPHVDEQPFTRSLTITIPSGVTTIILQAHDSVHGTGGKTFELRVP